MSVAELHPTAGLFTSCLPHGLGGLATLDGRAFPLQRVVVRASIAGPCARTVVEQRFANPYRESLDVTWTFPLPVDGALVELELEAGEIRVRGECQEREQAERTFGSARDRGHRAALVTKEQGNVHTLSLTGLPPKSDVIVRFTLVELLPVADGRFRFAFPTTIAPRYTPGTAVGHSGMGTHPDTDAVPDASRLTPPIRLAGGTLLDLEVEIAGPVHVLESSLHAARMQLDAGGVRVAPSARATLDRDFILEFATAASDATESRAWTDGRHTVVVVEPPVVTSRSIPRDAVFVLDISGSMEGVKLDAAKLALRTALHGLREGDRFKIIAFDTSVERFARDFKPYVDDNVEQAERWIETLHARGGTEMLQPLQEAMRDTTAKGRLRTVLLITDGQSNDEARLLPAILNRRGDAAVFTLGIDTAVNASLLKALARAGGGTCELCAPTDDIEAIVARIESRFGAPVLTALKVAGAARPEEQVVFAGRPTSVIIDVAPRSVALGARGVDGPFVASVTPERIAFPIGALWARERIAYLEERLTTRPFEEEAIAPEIRRIALEWHLASKYTAFVCVDRSMRNAGARRHVIQPVEQAAMWATPSASPRILASPSMRYSRSIDPMNIDDMEIPCFLRRSFDDAIEMPMFAAPAQSLAQSPPASPEPSMSGGTGAMRRDASSDMLAANTPAEIAGALARVQLANGSFGNDVGRTAAALVAFVVLGSTRRTGDRRRHVLKGCEWLAKHKADARAQLALDAVAAAETAEPLATNAAWQSLVTEGIEGTLLERVLTAHAAAPVPTPAP